MKKLFICIAFNVIGLFVFSQSNPIGRVFPVDTIGMNGGKTVIAPDQNRTTLRNDTLFFNADLQYLSWYYNSRNEDSLRNLSDTILYRFSKIFIFDETLNTYSDTFTKKIGFYWKKSIQFNESAIDSFNTLSKNSSGCTTNIYEDLSGYKCYEEVICWYQPADYWCSDYSYTKIFEDNFEGGKLNTNFWNYTSGGKGDVVSNNIEVSYNSDPAVSSGTLKLYTRYHSSPYIDPADNSTHTNQYSEGNINTSANFGFGKFEIRAKVPKIYGNNPAFWLYGAHAEIDGFEFFCTNRPDLPTFTVYTDANYQDFDSKCKVYSNLVRMSQNRADNLYGYGSWSNLPDLSLDWHTYVIVWDPEYIMWLIDDTYGLILFKKMVYGSGTFYCGCTNCTKIYHPQFPVTDGGMTFELQNAVYTTHSTSGAGDTQGPDSNSPSSKFEIDWVKIYAKDNCGITNANFPSNDPVNGFQQSQNGNKNDYTAKNLTFGGLGDTQPFTVNGSPYNSGHHDNFVFARADNEIALLNGFSVVAYSYGANGNIPANQGGDFEATIAYPGGIIVNGQPSQSDCANKNDYFTQWLRTTGDNNAHINIYSDPILSGMSQNTHIDNKDKGIKGLRIFPNPAQNELNITGLNDYQNIEVLNATLQSIKIIGKQEKIDVSELPSGLFFLRIYCGNTVIIRKFIKE